MIDVWNKTTSTVTPSGVDAYGYDYDYPPRIYSQQIRTINYTSPNTAAAVFEVTYTEEKTGKACRFRTAMTTRLVGSWWAGERLRREPSFKHIAESTGYRSATCRAFFLGGRWSEPFNYGVRFEMS